MTPDLAFALELAELADSLSLPRFRATDLVVERKPDRSPVTDADRPLDPIDGTRNFSRGIPVWATLVALEREGELALGVVSAPALGHRWWAARGEGAFRDGERITVSRTRRLEDAAVSCAYARDLARVEPAVWHARGFGDWWQSMLVAEGSLDAAVDANLATWDYAALVPIVEEAGGRATTPAGGSPAPKQQLVCTNGILHDELLALVTGASVR